MDPETRYLVQKKVKIVEAHFMTNSIVLTLHQFTRGFPGRNDSIRLPPNCKSTRSINFFGPRYIYGVYTLGYKLFIISLFPHFGLLFPAELKIPISMIITKLPVVLGIIRILLPLIGCSSCCCRALSCRLL